MKPRSSFAPLSALFALAASTFAQAPVAPPPAPAAAASSAPAPAAPAAANSPRISVSQCNVDGPFIAMTFDDGPHPQNTPRLLDMLKQRNLKATFFVVGQCAQEYPAIMKRIAEEGHELANHSWSHPQLTKLGEGNVSEQLQRTHDAIVETTGIKPTLMRPPYGAFTTNQRNWAYGKWGYKCILWDVDPLDWKVRNADHVKSEILRRTVNGSIILAHDIHKSTVDAMPDTFDGLIGRGFKFVTVTELLAMDRPGAVKPKTSAKAAQSASTTTAPAEPTRPAAETSAPAPAVKKALPR